MYVSAEATSLNRHVRWPKVISHVPNCPSIIPGSSVCSKSELLFPLSKYNTTSSIITIDKRSSQTGAKKQHIIFYLLLPSSFLPRWVGQHHANVSSRTNHRRQKFLDFHPLLNSLLSFWFSPLSSLWILARGLFVGFLLCSPLLGYPLCCQLHFLFGCALYFLSNSWYLHRVLDHVSLIILTRGTRTLVKEEIL